jgi:hypothetical protein
VDAEITGDSAVHVTTTNVTALTLEMGPGGCPLDVARQPVVSIDGQNFTAPEPGSDRSWRVALQKSGAQWAIADTAPVPGRHKVHGLQGPIDDAFLDSFVFVSPTGTPVVPSVAGWIATEEKHAITEWRRQFRGEAQVREDKDVTDADIAASNLVLWGDPGSNKILARIAPRLPVQWDAQGVAFHGNRYPDTHVPLLIYPNPLNPRKYVVLNSGFTFREYDYLNNARQTPKLPDYAVVDTTTPPNERYPGKIVLAGFFNEEWKP